MKKVAVMAVLLFSSAPGVADQSDPTKVCDFMASLAARAVQAKDQGADFVSFMDKVEGLDAPDEVKASLKYFVADAFAHGVTPEHAYTKSYEDCMSASKKK